jgi:hypothetical protein
VAKSSKKQSVCITADIAKMIVMDMHPPYMVQHDGFQDFVKFAFPGYELPYLKIQRFDLAFKILSFDL